MGRLLGGILDFEMVKRKFGKSKSLVNPKVGEIRKGYWEFVKLVAKKENKTTPALEEEMIEMFAEQTGRQALLAMLKEEFQDTKLEIVDKKGLKLEIKTMVDKCE